MSDIDGDRSEPTICATDILQQIYGYREFRGHQLAVIEATIAGHDSLVLMPTGGGKSICYQIPALIRNGVALIISPLIALMHDQVAALRQIGVRAACLNSALDARTQSDVLDQLRAGTVDLLYIAPERLVQEHTLRRLAALQVSLIAVDEAHCVAQWGHDFRQDYLALGQLREWFPGVPRMALTATADQRTREEIVARLALNEPRYFVSEFDRPNLLFGARQDRCTTPINRIS